MMVLLFKIFLLCLIPCLSFADIHNASTCNNNSESTDIQDAIDAAVDGDIVTIPAGTCTMDTSITINGKALVVYGAGEGSTVITASNDSAFDITVSNGEYTEISKLTLIRTDSHSRLMSLTGVGTGDTGNGAFRMYNVALTNTFESSVGSYGIDIYPTGGGPLYGLIDSNVFNNAKVFVAGGDYVDEGDTSWSTASSLGTKDNVFVENNVFNSDVHANAIDSNRGGRYVFRYNVLNGAYIEAHSGCPNGFRSVFSYEIYNNIINKVGGYPISLCFLIRGGNGVIYDNDVDSNLNGSINIDNEMVCSACLDPAFNCSEYPCQDQLGRGTDSGRTTAQTLVGVYEWNNYECADPSTGNCDGDMDFNIVCGDCPDEMENVQTNYLISDRDYFNDTELVGYTPYRYPHPLRARNYIGSGTTQTIGAGTNQIIQ
jgi:hypothetical protein